MVSGPSQGLLWAESLSGKEGAPAGVAMGVAATSFEKSVVLFTYSEGRAAG